MEISLVGFVRVYWGYFEFGIRFYDEETPVAVQFVARCPEEM